MPADMHVRERRGFHRRRRELRGELAKLLMLFSPAEDEPTGDHEPLMTIVEGDANPIDKVLGRLGLGRRRG